MIHLNSLDDNNSIFLVKNEHLGDNELENLDILQQAHLHRLQPVQNNTPTSSATSTETSTPTSSATSTETSTPTSSATSTETSTPTSSATSTETSTHTLSTTSTETSTHTLSTTSKFKSYNIEDENNLNVKKYMNPVHIVLIVVLSCLVLMILVISLITYKKKQKELNSRPSISYNNPIYSYDNSNVVEDDNDNTQTSFYDDAFEPNNTQYYDDVDPNHIINTLKNK